MFDDFISEVLVSFEGHRKDIVFVVDVLDVVALHGDLEAIIIVVFEPVGRKATKLFSAKLSDDVSCELRFSSERKSHS